MATDRLQDIESHLKAALLRHAQATTQRDEAAAGMRKETQLKAGLETERAALLKRAFGSADKLATLEISISNLDDRMAAHRAALRTAQPLIEQAAVEIVALRGEAREALNAVIAPMRETQINIFESAANALIDANAAIAALADLTAVGVSSFAESRIIHPVSRVELGHRPPAIDDIKACISPLRGVAMLIRQSAGIQAPTPSEPTAPESETAAVAAVG